MNTRGWIGIIGYPLTHSLSRSFHEKIFREKKLNYEFRVLEWNSVTFNEKISSLKQDRSCVGFSVTMPYKETMKSYCDKLDPLSAKTGVVNAVKNIHGKWHGFNTDGPGFLEGFRRWGTLPPKSATVAFFGCGATAKTLSFMLAQEGYRKFVFINRTLKKAIAWGEKLKTYFNDVICHPEPLNQEIFRSNLFILNTTPISTEHGLWRALSIEELTPPIWFFDVLYNPRSTWLLREFRRRSFRTMNGGSMFEAQARLSFKSWIGRSTPQTHPPV